MTRIDKVRFLLWVYFFLLIFEGALRKWILPGLSNPLLLAREPVCLAAIVIGWPYLMRGPWIKWILLLSGIGVLAFVLALAFGHGDLPTALYGSRVLILQMPVVFLFGSVFNRDDAWAFARVILILTIPMTFLIALQFSLPASHILNIAPGGEGTAGFSGAMGKMRPPGTFSFINGLATFYGLAAACCAAWILDGSRKIPAWAWVSAGALIFSLPISISRSMFFMYTLVLVASLAAAILSGRAVRNFLIGGCVIAGMFLLVSRSEFFQDAVQVFQVRWQIATDSEGGEEGVAGVLDHRVGGVLRDGFSMIAETPLAGMGIGLGTNIGAVRVSGERAFLVAEGAWASTVGELGPVLGFLLITLRVGFGILILLIAVLQARKGNVLPLVLGGSVLPMIFIGNTAQPTALGFLVFGAGFMLAACNSMPGVQITRGSRGHLISPGS